MADMFGIQESMQKITQIAEDDFPDELRKLAAEIFDSGGKTHGRNWADNTQSTIKRKGRNSPNIETGQLKDILTTSDILLDDNFIDELPITSRQGKSVYYLGYKYADSYRKFSDIGSTPDDDQYLADQLIEHIIQQYKG